jgi:hypothetical protein
MLLLLLLMLATMLSSFIDSMHQLSNAKETGRRAENVKSGKGM